jgi:hypothetical protein
LQTVAATAKTVIAPQGMRIETEKVLAIATATETVTAIDLTKEVVTVVTEGMIDATATATGGQGIMTLRTIRNVRMIDVETIGVKMTTEQGIVKIPGGAVVGGQGNLGHLKEDPQRQKGAFLSLNGRGRPLAGMCMHLAMSNTPLCKQSKLASAVPSTLPSSTLN